MKTALFSAIEQGIDQSGVIHGVSVITVGEAKGHNAFIDAESLRMFAELGNQFKTGVQVKADHGTGFSDIVGSLRNFRVEGEKVLADLHLLKTHDQYDTIVEMAEKMPGSFGLSVVFSPRPNEGEQVRPTELYSVDLVDQPAANPTGLFSSVFTFQTNSSETQTMNSDQSVIENFKALFKGELVPVAQLSAVQTEVTQLKANVETLSTQNGELSAKLEASEKQVAELKAVAEKAEADHKAALEAKAKEVEQLASAKAAALAASVGAPAVAAELKKSQPTISRAEFEALDHPARNKFMREGGKINQ